MNILKKLSAVISAAALTLTLTACQSAGGLLAPKAPDLNKKFTFTASLDCGGESLSANFAREDANSWRVEITDPYRIQGVNFSINGGEITAAFRELTAENLDASLFSDSEVSALVKTLESSVVDLNGKVTYNQDSYTVSWQDLLLSFPTGSSAPTALEMPSKGIKGEISEFKITGEILPGEVVINH